MFLEPKISECHYILWKLKMSAWLLHINLFTACIFGQSSHFWLQIALNTHFFYQKIPLEHQMHVKLLPYQLVKKYLRKKNEPVLSATNVSYLFRNTIEIICLGSNSLNEPELTRIRSNKSDIAARALL